MTANIPPSSFNVILRRVRGADFVPPERLLAVDPGETIGWASFTRSQLERFGELSLPKGRTDSSLLEAHTPILSLFGTPQLRPTIVVAEDYRVFGSKTRQHAWSDLRTVRLLGYLEAVCDQYNIPLYLQTAATKQFCTNVKLKTWGYYPVGRPHACDAVRHGCYWLLFNKGK